MAVTKEDLLIQIKADSSKAVQGLESVTAVLGSMERQLKTATVAQQKSATSLNDFGAMAAKAAGIVYAARAAFQTLGVIFSQTVGEYQKSADGLTRLANSLAIVGEKNVPRSIEAFRDFASVMQQTTTLEDDQAIALAAVGVAAGRTDAEVMKLIKTATNLSAVTGDSVQTSFHQLLATFKGTTRALEEMAPEIKNLTDQQVLAGGAVDLMAAKFNGAGEGLATTFVGQLEQAKNALGDLSEELGKVLASGFDMKGTASGFKAAVQSMTDFFAEHGAAMSATIAGISQAFKNFLLGISVGVLTLVEGILKPMAESLGSVFGISTGVIDKIADANKKLQDSMKSSQAASEKAFQAYEKQAQAAVAMTGKTRKPPAPPVSAESKNLLKELDAKLREMQKNAELANKTELQQIAIKADWQRKDLQVLEEKLKKERVLTDEAKKKLALARAATKEQENQEKAKLEKSVNAAVGSFAQSGDSAKDAIRQQFADMQKLLDMKREFLFMKGPPPANALKDLEAQQQILAKRQTAAVAATPSNEFENAKASGDVIAAKISGAITGPGVGAITGALSGAMSVIGAAQGAIDMVQSLLDAVPKLLESFAGLIDTLTNLPLRLAEAIGKVFTSIINFVRNFLPNIVKMLDSILEGIVSFVEELPEAFMEMVDNLSTMLTNLIEKLPQLAERLVVGLIEMGPEIGLKMMEFIFSKLPDLAMRLVKVIAFRLPIALIDGLVKGLSKVRDLFANLFKGKWPKAMTAPDIKVDGKQAAKAIAQLTKDTNKLFSVSALEKMAGDGGTADPAKAIEDATKKSINWLADAWNKTVSGLRTVWLWIYDKVLNPIIMALRQVWLWIYDRVITPILNGLRAVWLWLYNSVIMPLLNGIRAVWLWVYEGVILPIFSGLQAVWGTIMEVVMQVFSGIGEGLSALFEGIGAVFSGLWQAGAAVFAAIPELFAGIWNAGKAMFSAIPEIFSKIWASFEGVFGRLGDIGKTIMRSLSDGLSNIGSSISNMFSGIGKMCSSLFKFDMSGVAKGIEDAFSKAGDFLKDAFRGVLNPIVDVFNGLIDMLDGFKIPALSVGVPRWAGGGKWDLWGEIDLIPGDIGKIAKFAQGGLVSGPGGIDRVPAMLTAGEFVMSRPAVEAIGLPTLRAMNAGQGGASNVTQHYTFNLKIDAKDKVDETFIKQRLMPAIREELKRSSLDGRAIVYAGGVRA